MQAEGDIDPRLREPPSQQPSQPYPVLGHSNYALNPNPIRLPPPQQHHTPIPPWPQDGSQSFYTHRIEQPAAHHLPPPDIVPHHEGLQPQHGEHGTSDSKRPRACEACRGLKVRCEPDPIKGTCRRCAKAGRQCVVTAPSRKRQKKTDSRVAELEKKIDALTASLHATKAQAASESDDESPEEQDSAYNFARRRPSSSNYKSPENRHDLETPRITQQHLSDLYRENGDSLAFSGPMNNDRKRRLSEYHDDEGTLKSPEARSSPTTTDHRTKLAGTGISTDRADMSLLRNETTRPIPPVKSKSVPSPSHEYADVVDRKILDSTTASEIFYHYTTEMACHMPIVVFPPDTVAGTVRKTRPILFLAILSVASGQNYPDLQRTLTKEVMHAFADRIIYRGEKSLELIQALQVSTIWYWPEDNRDAQFYQMIHIAAFMAIDLGLGRRAKGSRESYNALWKDYPRMKSVSQMSDTVNGRRAWLGCYLLCAKYVFTFRALRLDFSFQVVL